MSDAARKRSTAIGAIAILLWSLLALFTAASGTVPPFQLTAMSFAIGGLAGAISWLFRPRAIASLIQPWPVWLLGVGGLFGYHFAYFTALRNAPPVEAGLIAYLWPLFILLFSALLPGERLRWYHLAGGALGLVGAGLLVSGGTVLQFKSEFAFGYSMALIGALIWSSYSVLSRRFASVPTDTVAGFCLVTAVLAAAAHLLLEETQWPVTSIEWLAVAGLGLGPVGLAFYVWDHGVKRGDIQVLGACSYLAPLLSTLALIVAGFAQWSGTIMFACLFITCGALLAASSMFRRSA